MQPEKKFEKALQEDDHLDNINTVAFIEMMICTVLIIREVLMVIMIAAGGENNPNLNQFFSYTTAMIMATWVWGLSFKRYEQLDREQRADAKFSK